MRNFIPYSREVHYTVLTLNPNTTKQPILVLMGLMF